jgi:hypothetical protein
VGVVEWYLRGRAAANDGHRRSVRPATHGVCGPSRTAVGEVEEVGVTRGAEVEAGVTRGTAVGAARGRNLGGTVGVGRGATSGSNSRGTSGAGWQGAMVLAVVSWVPTVKTVEPDSQRKSRSAGLGEALRGKLSSPKTTCREMIRQFMERSR